MALPGLGLTSDYLFPLALALAPQLRVYLLDLPGSGGAPGPARPLRAGHLADVVVAWVEANELSDVLLFGNSFGSEVAVETATRLTGAVAGVVLGAPTPDPGARSLPRQLGRLLLAARRAPDPLVALAVRDYRRTGLRRLLREGLAALHEPIVERLRRLEVPTLIVCGEHDPVVPRRWAADAAEVARGRLCVVAGAGHATPYEAPETLARIIGEFAAEVPRDR